MSAGDEAREVLSWETFGQAARELAGLVLQDFMPDIVVAVARGGLVPAGAVSYALGVKAIGTLNVEFYTDVAQTLPDPVVLPPILDGGALAGLKALVVDDVADSGRTLALVLDLVSSYGAEARSAVLYSKPTSVIEPDYVWRRTDLWITFPWSALPPVRREESAAVSAESGDGIPHA
jgi:hypoxanthine phosphoribosyltransferase